MFHFESISPPPHIPEKQWTHWGWQMQNSLKTPGDFEKNFNLSEKDKKALEKSKNTFAMKTTPYSVQLCRKYSALRQIALPHLKELNLTDFYQEDPLGEKKHSPAPRIIHRYPDRVLFLVTDFCGIYCRYCTRKYFTAQGNHTVSSQDYQKALQYIQNNQGIREVILSGGDPLTLSNNKIKNILKDLRSIPHIEIIRIGSRMPVVCPFRIDEELIDLLKTHQPIFVMTHFNHPKELTAECVQHLLNLCNNGISVYNQMVLLNGINNHPALVQALNRRLLFIRVRPYYMFQCDPSKGTGHFRTTIENSKWIQRELWGVLSGLAAPRLSMDLPHGGGKVELVPDHFIKKQKNTFFHKGFDGMTSGYPNPLESKLPDDEDIQEYLEEWKIIKTQPYGSLKKKNYASDSI